MASTELARVQEGFDPKKNIILHPVTITDEGAFSPMLRESVSVVQINTALDAGEVYHEPRYAKQDFRDQSKSRFALTAGGLNKIAAAAGIKWVPEGCDVVERERRGRHVYIRYRATGAVRQPNGEWHLEVAEKEIDTEDVEERMTEQDRRQWEKWVGKKVDERRTPYWIKDLGTDAVPDDVQRVIRERVRQQILQLKEFLLGHAETKAKNRVIRRLLDVKQTYSVADLAKPFVVPRLVYRPDLTDPRELERVQFEGRRAAAELYGGASPVSSSSEGLAEVRPLPDRASPVADEESGAPGGKGGAEVTDLSTSARRSGTSAKPEAKAEVEVQDDGPHPPKDDPMFEDGQYKGERMSYVAERDPSYLRGLLQNTRSAKKREVIQGWLDWAQPTLGG